MSTDFCFWCSTTCVSYAKVNDGIADCEDERDESTLAAAIMYPILNIHRSMQTFHPCPNHYFLCNSFREHCYHKSKICVFERDLFGEPLYCPDTENLRHCEKHTCPGYYKCHRSFCIPVHALCDGVEDCPSGEDEVSCKNFQCTGVLKCKGNSSVTNKTDCSNSYVHANTSVD